MTEARLDEILAPGVAPDEVPELAPLLQARPLLAAFSTLFHGSEAEVLMRLLVLREIGRETDARAGAPTSCASASPSSTRSSSKPCCAACAATASSRSATTTATPSPTSAATRWPPSACCSASPPRTTSSSASSPPSWPARRRWATSPRSLGHLLGKLNDLAWHFEDAIASGSEFRISDARRRLSANTRWIEKGTEVLRQLLADPDVSFELARVAQRIGLAQSRLARVDAAFQRALNKIEAQRVTLGGSGISSSDVAGWLRRQDARHLAGLAVGVLALAPELTLLAGGHELLDRAELTLSDEARQIEADTALPPPKPPPAAPSPSRRPAPAAALQPAPGPPRRAWPRPRDPRRAGLRRRLPGRQLPPVAARPARRRRRRGRIQRPADGPIGDFMRLPLDVHFDAATVAVGSDEIAAMSAGLVGARGSLPAPQAVPVLDATALPPDEA
jgi:hypothetical protein